MKCSKLCRNLTLLVSFSSLPISWIPVFFSKGLQVLGATWLHFVSSLTHSVNTLSSVICTCQALSWALQWGGEQGPWLRGALTLVAWFLVTRCVYLPDFHPLCRQTYLLCPLPPAFSAKSYHISNSTWYLLGCYTKFCKARGITWLEGILFILLPRGHSVGFDDP